MNIYTISICIIVIILFILLIYVPITYYSQLDISKESQSVFVLPSIPQSMTQYVSSLPEEQREKCKNQILWVNTPNVNNQCNIRSMNDSYNFINCNQPTVCDNFPRGYDRSDYCKMVNCKVPKKNEDNNDTVNNKQYIIDLITEMLKNQRFDPNNETERCQRSVRNLLDINNTNNDQILFLNKMQYPMISQEDIAYNWLMCNAEILCKPIPGLQCDILTTLLGDKRTAKRSIGLELNGINQNGTMYQLFDYYDSVGLFDRFTFVEGPDPMNGYNNNVSKLEALQQGLFTYNDTMKYNRPHKQCIIKVSKILNNSTNFMRNSIKMESQKPYNGGLFILDIDHMPSGLSVWPIFSLNGKNWPCDGEIRIGQTFNSIDWNSSQNFTSLHTEQICIQDTIPGITNEGVCGSGIQYSGNRICRPCDKNNGNDCPYNGCGIFTGSGTAGDSFNKQGGGVFACEWILDGTIKIWIVPRIRVPEYVPFYADKLDTSKWPIPHVEFKPCPGSFTNNYLTLSTTLCGERGDEYFMAKKSGSCASYIADPDSNFDNAKWIINYLKVFQKII